MAVESAVASRVRSGVVGATDLDSIDLCGLVARAVADDSTDGSRLAGLCVVSCGVRGVNWVGGRMDRVLVDALPAAGGSCATGLCGGVRGLTVLDAPGDA